MSRNRRVCFTYESSSALNARYSQTEPESFYLDLLFNASTINQSDSKDKRPPNELVPTSIAYTGGQMDFTVKFGTEVSAFLLLFHVHTSFSMLRAS